MAEILEEALKEKLPADAVEDRYFSLLSLESVLSKYVETDEALSSAMQEIEYLGDPVSIEDIDNSGIIAKYVPAHLVDAAETDLLKTTDPLKEVLEDIEHDVNYLMDPDLGIADLSLFSDWVKQQLWEFIDRLHTEYPRDVQSYLELRDKSILD